MRSSFRSMCLVSALMLAACGGSGDGGDQVPFPASLPVNQEYLLGYGEAIDVGSITLEFTRVEEETRCPINASCVAFWQGNARIAITATSGHMSEVLLLNTFPGYATSATFEGYVIELRSLAPGAPFQPQPLGEYTATLFVKRAGR